MLAAISMAARIGSRATADRKSTRLNSSHQIISYAVFCLKKKKIGQVLVRRQGDHRVVLTVGHREITLLLATGPQDLPEVQRHRGVHLRLSPQLLAIVTA